MRIPIAKLSSQISIFSIGELLSVCYLDLHIWWQNWDLKSITCKESVMLGTCVQYPFEPFELSTLMARLFHPVKSSLMLSLPPFVSGFKWIWFGKSHLNRGPYLPPEIIFFFFLSFLVSPFWYKHKYLFWLSAYDCYRMHILSMKHILSDLITKFNILSDLYAYVNILWTFLSWLLLI